MERKHRLQKGTALLSAGVMILVMGSCTRNFEISNIPSETQMQTKQVTMVEPESLESTKYNTSLIFEDPELLEMPETTDSFLTENITEVTVEDEKVYKSRFTNQEQLVAYLEQTYYDSGKNYWQIIDEAREKENNGEFYSYRNDLSASAAYMLLKDNGLTLDDVSLELDYLLSLIITPREELEEDRLILKVFYDITEYKYNIYETFEQLALERHMVKCIDKDKHTIERGWISCPRLNPINIIAEINSKTNSNDVVEFEEFEIGSALIERIEQLTRSR